MKEEERLLLICADPRLISKPRLLDEAGMIISAGVDWRLFFKGAAVNGIFPQAYENSGCAIERLGMNEPPMGHAEWRHLYFQTIARNMKLCLEAAKALRSLSAAGIPFTPLKGYLIKGLYYPKSVTRDFDDVDLLFPYRGSRLRAKALLESQGFIRLTSGADAYHFKMEKKARGSRVLIELHQRIGATTYYGYPRMGDLWGSLTRASIGGVEMMVMPPEHALLVSSLNALRDGAFRLKDLADMLALTGSEQSFRWRLLNPYAEEIGWSHILALPLHALEAYHSAMGLKNSEGKHAPGWLSYPIPYSRACSMLSCRREPEGAVFSVPGESLDLTRQTSGEAFGSFIRTLLQQGRLLITHVQPDYGMVCALSCAGQMATHAARMAMHEVRMRLPGSGALPPEGH